MITRSARLFISDDKILIVRCGSDYTNVYPATRRNLDRINRFRFALRNVYPAYTSLVILRTV